MSAAKLSLGFFARDAVAGSGCERSASTKVSAAAPCDAFAFAAVDGWETPLGAAVPRVNMENISSNVSSLFGHGDGVRRDGAGLAGGGSRGGETRVGAEGAEGSAAVANDFAFVLAPQ